MGVSRFTLATKQLRLTHDGSQLQGFGRLMSSDLYCSIKTLMGFSHVPVICRDTSSTIRIKLCQQEFTLETVQLGFVVTFVALVTCFKRFVNATECLLRTSLLLQRLCQQSQEVRSRDFRSHQT